MGHTFHAQTGKGGLGAVFIFAFESPEWVPSFHPAHKHNLEHRCGKVGIEMKILWHIANEGTGLDRGCPHDLDLPFVRGKKAEHQLE